MGDKLADFSAFSVSEKKWDLAHVIFKVSENTEN